MDIKMSEHKVLYQAAIYLLQSAYASPARALNYDVTVLEMLGFDEAAENAAIKELQALALLEKGKFEGAVRPTKKGWAFIRKTWPNGQLPGTEKASTVVIGSFDGQWDLPVRQALPVARLTDLIPGDSRFAGEMERDGLRYSAWELVYPPTGEAEDRILVRIEEGTGNVLESPTESDVGHVFGVRPGTWLSVDRKGRCREAHRTLEEMVFLIAMGAA